MTDENVRELLAELDAGETLNNVIIHAIERGRTQGYDKGWHVGFMQAKEESGWAQNAAQS
jgi:hypothetical protein